MRYAAGGFFNFHKLSPKCLKQPCFDCPFQKSVEYSLFPGKAHDIFNRITHDKAFQIFVWLRLKDLARYTGQTIYQIKHGLLSNYLVQQLKRWNVYRLVVWRAAQCSYAIACDRCVSTVTLNFREKLQKHS